MVTVVALRSFRYRDRDLQSGDDVEMSPVDASAHAFAHRVSLLARPSYLTRDMVAAGPAQVVVPGNISAETAKRIKDHWNEKFVGIDAPDDDPAPVVRRRRGRPRKSV